MVRNILQESFRKQDSESCNLVAFQGSVLRYLGYAVLSQKKEKVKKERLKIIQYSDLYSPYTESSKERSPRKYCKTGLELA